MHHRSEKSDEIRMVIKWIFFLTIGFIIYVSLKFINEREITLPQVGADLGEGTVKATSRALEEGTVVSKDVVEKSTYVTKDIITKGIAVTKQIIVKNIEEKNNPQKKAAIQQPAKTVSTPSAPADDHEEEENINNADIEEDDEDEYESYQPRPYRHPLF